MNFCLFRPHKYSNSWKTEAASQKIPNFHKNPVLACIYQAKLYTWRKREGIVNALTMSKKHTLIINRNTYTEYTLSVLWAWIDEMIWVMLVCEMWDWKGDGPYTMEWNELVEYRRRWEIG